MKEERKRILEMVQNGELTIEEAEKLLSVLEGIKKDKQSDTASHQITPEVDFQSNHEEQTKSKESSSTKSTESTKEKIINLVETALNKIKEIDLDFHHSVEVNHTIQQNFSDFNKVFIDVPNGSIHLVSWDHSDVRVECNAKVFRTEDSTIGKQKLLETIDFDVRNQQLVFGSNDKITRVNAKIYIPQRQYDKISVKLFNGTIIGEELHSEYLDFKTANGKIDVTKCEGGKAEIESGNGAITVVDANFSDFEAETINGKVNVDGNFQKLDLQTLGGSIFSSVKNQDVDTIRAESATGSVYVKVPNELAVLGELKSNIGNVQVHLDNVHKKEEKNEIIQKLLKFEKDGDGEKKLYIFAESKTGSVFVQPL